MKLEFESNTSTLPYSDNTYSSRTRPEYSAADIIEMLKAGIKAAQEGDRSEARQMLVQVTEAEPDNETAWLWMASISEYPEELIIFLNNVLSINPSNARALEWMKSTKDLLARTFVERGSEALKDANAEFAKQCFWQAIAHDDHNETAWLSLAAATDSIEEKITYLQKVIYINPENQTALKALQTAKTQAAEALLRSANSAAVAGKRDEAREMVQEVFNHSPELEEAWILKSYLAESFSEKIICFEKVLSFNPENEMAIAGLASLRATMAKTEAKKAEQAALIAEFKKKIQAEAAPPTPAEPEFSFSAMDAADDNPTQKLEFPPDFVPAEFPNEGFYTPKFNSSDEPLEFSNFVNAAQDDDNFHQNPEEALPQMNFQEIAADEKLLDESELMSYDAFEKHSFLPEEAEDNRSELNFENHQANPFAEVYSEPASESDFLIAEDFAANDSSQSFFEVAVCPFCSAENEANAFVCGSCQTILTLSDLEMLLAHADADREVLRQAVERMESEKNFRDYDVNALKNLAIGQINLKNLRQGVAHLQKAAQLCPNDVVLGAQVNFLKIRLSEIEQQEINNSHLTKGRNILVVDDSATVRKLISGKLEKSGHAVISAVDGVDAMEKIKEFTPDLILLDIMMPNLDGYQVCKLIRANEATKDVPVVMISGKDGFFDKVRGRMAGTTGYITKPFGPETLMKAVETHIAHQDEMITDDENLSAE